MTDNKISYIRGASPEDHSENKKVYPSIVEHLEDLIIAAKKGEVRTLAVVHADDNGHCGYAILGVLDGYMLQGAVNTMLTQITYYDMNRPDVEDA